MVSKGSYLRTKARKSSHGFWTELTIKEGAATRMTYRAWNKVISRMHEEENEKVSHTV